VHTAVGVGFIAGPAIGGWIAAYGLQYPAYVSSILLTADVLFITLLLPDVSVVNHQQHQQPGAITIEAPHMNSIEHPSTQATDDVLAIVGPNTSSSAWWRFGWREGVLLVYWLYFLATLVCMVRSEPVVVHRQPATHITSTHQAETLSRSSFQQFTILRYSLTPQENGYVMAYQSLLQVIVQGLMIGPLNRHYEYAL
jgi:MFS family permease